MAHLQRLIFAALLVLATPAAFAACIAKSDGEICDSRAEAEASQMAGVGGQGLGAPIVKYEAVGPMTYVSGDANNGRQYMGRVDCGVEGYPDAACTGGSFGWGYWWAGPSSQECDARNSDPEQQAGPGLYLDSQVGDRCIGGCVLTVVGDPIEVVQGRVQGQPANFYRFNREYSGETCDGTDPPDETELAPTEDGPECNMAAGVCVTTDGKTEYCTFNPDGSPSSCVPADDYDNDGILDEDDADPGDAQDSTDQGDGDEKDNVASGGASCSTAPSCTGDGIACATLYQQWKTRCAVEALQIAVDVNVPPGEYQEIQAGDLGNANDFGDAGVTASDAWRPNGTGTGNGTNPTFDDSGWLASRSCPVIPVVSTSIMGNAISIDFNNPQLCWFLSIGAQLVLVFAALASIRIYWKVI